MSEKYIISVDQSTQGTKALLFSKNGDLIKRTDCPHEQIINEKGWVSHNPEEIYKNTVSVIKKLIETSDIDKNDVAGIGISNQRETSLLWNRKTGKPLDNAIVWQCQRAAYICEKPEIKEKADVIRSKTGLVLSPYFPAAKISWLLQNVPGALELAEKNEICHGTVDSWLVYKLTDGKSYKTDYSNASRTQLFNLFDLKWDEEICNLFGIDVDNMPEVCDSNSLFGYTTLQGYFSNPVPIHGVLGDSHAALFGQGCFVPGMTKTTYGTGSSIMMNIGEKPVLSSHGVVTSIAWGIDGKVEYVLEGNLNYTGAVITWLKDDMKMIDNPSETQYLAESAAKNDSLYLIPAFTGLGAPYWNSSVRAAVIGMSRTTGRAEFVRAGLECIAYQITDVINAMEEDSNVKVEELRVDGGPTKNQYLMQFQSNILDKNVSVSSAEEVSGIGAAYIAGIALGVFNKDVFNRIQRNVYTAKMDQEIRTEKYAGWIDAIKTILKER